MDSGVLEGDYQILVATGVFAGQINVWLGTFRSLFSKTGWIGMIINKTGIQSKSPVLSSGFPWNPAGRTVCRKKKI
jgi:hypothetical protein